MCASSSLHIRDTRPASRLIRRQKNIRRYTIRLFDDQGDDQQRHNVDHFDHRIDSRASGVLIGIADRITSHRSLMRIRAFQSLLLDILLGIVPSTPSTRHGNRDEQSRDDAPDQHAPQRLRS